MMMSSTQCCVLRVACCVLRATLQVRAERAVGKLDGGLDERDEARGNYDAALDALLDCR